MIGQAGIRVPGSCRLIADLKFATRDAVIVHAPGGTESAAFGVGQNASLHACEGGKIATKSSKAF